MKYVPSIGPKNAKIVFVGEAPGEQEEKQGQPFVGIAGQRLREDCAKVGIDVARCFVTNVCHYRPPKNDIWKYIKRSKRKGVVKIVPNQLVKNGIMELFRDLAEIRRNEGAFVIVPLGNVALWALTGHEQVSVRRGSVYTIQPNLQLLEQFSTNELMTFVDDLKVIQGIKVVPTLHPAAVERQMVMQPIFVFDLKRIRDESRTRDTNYPTRTLYVDPPESVVQELVGKIPDRERLACDIETPNGALYCIGFSCNPSEAFVMRYNESWKRDRIVGLLQHPRPKIFQNGVYDCSFLRREHAIDVVNYEYDTMFAQHASYPEWKIGLAFQASMYTREPYYKDEGKGHDVNEFDQEIVPAGTHKENNTTIITYRDMPRGEMTYLAYCAKDAAITKEVCQEQLNDEMSDPLVRAMAEYYMRQAPIVIDIMSTGMHLDLKEIRRLREQSEAKLKELQPKLDQEILGDCIAVIEKFDKTGKNAEQAAAALELAEKISAGYHSPEGGFNVGSSPDCQKYLYKVRGFKEIKKKSKTSETGESVTADEEAIKELYGDTGDQKLLRIIEIRKERKSLTSFLNVKTKPDGQTFFSINPVGTKSARWSSSMDLQGYGLNMQTIPPKLRSMVVPDSPEFVLIYADLSQAEDRIVSYLAHVHKKIYAFEHDLDAHVLTGSLIFGIEYDQLYAENKAHKAKTGKEDPRRYLGKQSNHAFNYGEGPVRFTKAVNKRADETGVRVTIPQSKKIRAGHLSSYPEIQWYWQDIEAQLKNGRTLYGPRIGDEKPFKRVFSGRLNDETFREAYSYIPQRCAPTIVNLAMIDIHNNLLPRVNVRGGQKRARILLQVHDALLAQIPRDGAEDIANEFVRAMEIPVELHNRQIIIPTDYKLGDNWKELG